MTENLQEKLHQGERKQLKGAKNAPKLSAKYLEDKIC